MRECYTLGVGEAQALGKIEKLLAAGFDVISDPVGEEIKELFDARRAVRSTWRHMKRLGVLRKKYPDRYIAIAIKPSRFGAKLDLRYAKRYIRTLFIVAIRRDLGFEIDMEGKELMRGTLDIARSLLREGNTHWLALPANQTESRRILIRAVQSGLHNFRLVLGAYQGDIKKYHEIDRNYLALARLVKEHDADAAYATHKESRLHEAGTIDPTARTQMLYGVCMKLQTQLVLSRKYGGPRHIIYGPWAENEEDAFGYLLRRAQEGIRLNVILLFLRNIVESRKWRKQFFADERTSRHAHRP